MKLRFIFLSLLFSVILLSCGWQIPEKISVKSNASYNFTTGEIDTKLNDSLNFDELIKPDENSEFTVYNYLPDGKSRQFVMRMAIADIPIDLESSFNESSINEAIKDLSFTQEIKVPSISFSSQTKIPLGGFSGAPVDEVKNIDLNELNFNFTLNDTESDIFESCEVGQGKLFTEIIIPSDWEGVSVSYSFSTTGGLEVSDVNASGQKKTINLAGKTITKDQVNATAQITLTVQPSYKVSSSPLMLKISSDIESLETLNVNLSDVTTSFNKKEPLPEGMRNAFSKICLNSSGVKIDYVNTLPEGNDIKLKVKSEFFWLKEETKTGDLKANTQGELELLSDSSKEIVINDSSSYDFGVNISLPGAEPSEPQKVSLKYVKFGDTYQISMNITPVLNWEKIVLKEGFAKNDKKELPFNIKELLSSVSDKISDENLFANIEIKSLPIYVFFTKPQTNGSDLFTNSKFTGKMSVYYGTYSNPKQEDGVDISQTLVDKDSTDENIPREIGFVDYPELNISEDNKKVLSSLDNVSFSLKGDVAKIINSAIKDTSGSSNSLYVDYDLEFTNGSNGELEISKDDLAKKGSIGVYIYIVLPFEFRVSEEVNVSAQKLLNDTDGDIFGRKSKDDFVNVEDYFALINSASVYYEFTKLPVCSDDSDSIAFDIGMDCGEGGANKIPITEDSSIRKGTITISKKNVEDMLKEYPVKPTMNLSIKENSEFYIPQIFDVAVKLNLNIQTDGEIEIFGGQ